MKIETATLFAARSIRPPDLSKISSRETFEREIKLRRLERDVKIDELKGLIASFGNNPKYGKAIALYRRKIIDLLSQF